MMTAMMIIINTFLPAISLSILPSTIRLNNKLAKRVKNRSYK